MFKVKITIPDLAMELDEKAIYKKVGDVVAKTVAKRMKSGRGADGAMPPPDNRANMPLNATGELIGSLKYRPAKKTKSNKKPTGGTVYATGTRAADRGLRNGAILAMNLAQRPDLDRSDPMGVDATVMREARDAANTEIVKQARGKKVRLRAKKKKVVQL